MNNEFERGFDEGVTAAKLAIDTNDWYYITDPVFTDEEGDYDRGWVKGWTETGIAWVEG